MEKDKNIYFEMLDKSIQSTFENLMTDKKLDYCQNVGLSQSEC